MQNRNGVPFDLKRAEVRTRKTDYCDLILRKILLRQGTNGSLRHHFCLLKACGNGGAIVKKALIVLNKTQGHYLPLCFSFRFCCFKSNRYSCRASFCSLLTVFRIRFCSSCCNFSAS